MAIGIHFGLLITTNCLRLVLFHKQSAHFHPWKSLYFSETSDVFNKFIQKYKTSTVLHLGVVDCTVHSGSVDIFFKIKNWLGACETAGITQDLPLYRFYKDGKSVDEVAGTSVTEEQLTELTGKEAPPTKTAQINISGEEVELTDFNIKKVHQPVRVLC